MDVFSQALDMTADRLVINMPAGPFRTSGRMTRGGTGVSPVGKNQ